MLLNVQELLWPIYLLLANIQTHFCKFTQKVTLLPSSCIPAAGTTVQVCTAEVQCCLLSVFLLHSVSLSYIHSMIKSCVVYTQYVKCICSLSYTRLPFHFIWTAKVDLLIFSHHLFLVHCKDILQLKPGSSLYNMNTNYKCHLNFLLKKIAFLFMILM